MVEIIWMHAYVEAHVIHVFCHRATSPAPVRSFGGRNELRVNWTGSDLELMPVNNNKARKRRVP